MYLFYPLVQVAYYSTTRWSGLGPIRAMVGLNNYLSLLTSGDFLSSFKVNLIYTVTAALFSVVLGFLLAASVRQRMRGWRFHKVAWFVPVLIPGTVVAILWSSAVFAPTVGLIDTLLLLLGLPTPEKGWLGIPDLALIVVIVVAIWASTGWPMLILLAAMERIAAEIYEAATLDGASPLQLTRYVTFPLVRPVIAAVITLQIVFGLKVFDLVYVMTTGGPADYTRVTAILMYNLAFTAGQFQVDGANVSPGPVQQPRVPLLIAGGGERITLRQVAALAEVANFGSHAWTGSAFTPDDVRPKYAALRGYCDGLDRPFDSILRSLYVPSVVIARACAALHAKLNTLNLASSVRYVPIHATPDQAIAAFQALVSAGAQYFLVAAHPHDEETLTLLAQKVLPESGPGSTL